MQEAMALPQPPPPRSIAADAALKGSLASLMLALTDGLKSRRSLILSFDECGQAMERLPAHRQPPPPTSIVLDAAEADAVKKSLASLVLALTDVLKARLSLDNYGDEEPAASSKKIMT
ncbi:hypothetical protein ZWY2020_053991 [Hordeum vulgare]|nr:hypothetical protein ZWY2020_053991 [Hordeum vulgare]